jgi:hypothetical protein
VTPSLTSQLSPKEREVFSVRGSTLVFRSHHHGNGIAGRVAGNRLLRHQDRLLVHPFLVDGTHIHFRQQQSFRAGEECA